MLRPHLPETPILYPLVVSPIVDEEKVGPAVRILLTPVGIEELNNVLNVESPSPTTIRTLRRDPVVRLTALTRHADANEGRPVLLTTGVHVPKDPANIGLGMSERGPVYKVADRAICRKSHGSLSEYQAIAEPDGSPQERTP